MESQESDPAIPGETTPQTKTGVSLGSTQTPNPIPGPRGATRADVARYAGVSTAVVSYVLHNGPRPVAAATRKRVLHAIEALDYRPNPAARTLATGFSDLIGLLVVDSRNPYFAQYSYALNQAAERNNRSLLITNANREGEHSLELIHQLAARRVSGLILSENNFSSNDIHLVSKLGIPTVFINQNDSTIKNSVGIDFHASSMNAVNHLISHGHRTISYVGGNDPQDQRERGWSDALTEARLPLGPRVEANFSYKTGFDAGMLFARMDTLPDAVFAASDQIGVGLLAAFNRCGISVPNQIAVLSFDGIVESEFTSPALTTVAQPIETMAEEVIARILGAPNSLPALYPVELIVRDSCGC